MTENKRVARNTELLHLLTIAKACRGWGILHFGIKLLPSFLITACSLLFFASPLFPWGLIADDPQRPCWHLFQELALRQENKALPPYFSALPLRWIRQNYSSVELFGNDNERKFAFDISPLVSWYHTTSPYPGIILGSGYEDDRVAFYSSYRIDKELLRSPSYSGKRWRGFAGEGELIAIALRPAEGLYIWLGRNRLALGSGLFLSHEHRPLDGVTALWLRKNFRIIAFCYSLDRLRNADETDIYRWLSGHRFELSFPFISLGAGELIIYGGEDRQPELHYLLPLYFYHGEQLNRPYDDNTMLIFDLRARHRGFYLSIEFLLDDIQIEHTKPVENEPPLYGFNCELLWRDRRTTVGLGYRRISNWTFNQRRFYNRYLYDDEPLADSLGNDCDRLSVSIEHRFTPWLLAGIGIEQERLGEGRITAPWDMPWVEAEGEYKEPFPTGIVEQRRKLFLSSVGYWTSRAEWKMKLGYQWIANREHIIGNAERGFIFSLALRLAFRYEITNDR